jgi:hypothetical protein
MQVVVGSTTTDVVATPQGGNRYLAQFPAIPCTAQFSYSFRVDLVGDSYADPSGLNRAIAASGVSVTLNDECETQGAWSLSAPGDDATAGLWVNADPVGTAAQPEDDHTATGTRCFVTGNGAVGGAVGAADIDGGTTTLTSPTFLASGPNSFISYWRWYSNNQGAAPGEDIMPVLISNDGGANWVQLELVVENAGAWVQKSFRIADFVTPTANMKLRFLARDLANGSVVEAAVDDVQVINYDCSVAADINRDGKVDGADLGLLLSGWGQAGATDLNQDGATNGADLGSLLSAWAP